MNKIITKEDRINFDFVLRRYTNNPNLVTDKWWIVYDELIIEYNDDATVNLLKLSTMIDGVKTLTFNIKFVGAVLSDESVNDYVIKWIFEKYKENKSLITIDIEIIKSNKKFTEIFEIVYTTGKKSEEEKNKIIIEKCLEYANKYKPVDVNKFTELSTFYPIVGDYANKLLYHEPKVNVEAYIESKPIVSIGINELKPIDLIFNL